MKVFLNLICALATQLPAVPLTNGHTGAVQELQYRDGIFSACIQFVPQFSQGDAPICADMLDDDILHFLKGSRLKNDVFSGLNKLAGFNQSGCEVFSHSIHALFK